MEHVVVKMVGETQNQPVRRIMISKDLRKFLVRLVCMPDPLQYWDPPCTIYQNWVHLVCLTVGDTQITVMDHEDEEL
ncbi:hypothetical protein C0J52_06844 [Blattella germanica]|nr:hypothetical protein C0J52_06844 [Blattella germanica]